MTTHKQKGILATFALRWFVCALGLWIAAGLFQRTISYGGDMGVIIIAGALLALLNTVLKPVLVLVSMPVMIITLGLFMVFLNGLTVYLVSLLYSPLHIAHFRTAIATGLVVGLVNYLVTTILDKDQ